MLPRTIRLTLLLFSLSLVLAVAASDNHNPFGLHRRVVKKRSPLNAIDIQPNAQASSATAQLTPSATAVAQTTPASPTPVQSSGGSSASASPSPSTTGDNASTSLVGGLSSSASSSTSSTLSSTSSSTSAYSSSTPQTSSPNASNTLATTPSQSVVYLTSSSMATPTQSSSPSSSTGISHAAVTVLIVIAACIGASVIVWTIIRKWKFRPSSDFEGRMQPIDWQPEGSSEDAGLPGHHRPGSRASSFHSGSANPHMDEMRGPVGGYGGTTLNPIPDHDFTAGPAHFAAVGGYADLARGPSPQPMMQESFAGAPSVNRPGQYDQIGVPLYHGYGGY